MNIADFANEDHGGNFLFGLKTSEQLAQTLKAMPRKPLDFLQVAEERREGPDEIGVDSGPKRLGCGVKPREGEEMYFPELLNVDQLKNEVAYCAGAYEALHRVDLLDVSAEMRNSDE
jgi:hypothetical protein